MISHWDLSQGRSLGFPQQFLKTLIRYSLWVPGKTILSDWVPGLSTHLVRKIILFPSKMAQVSIGSPSRKCYIYREISRHSAKKEGSLGISVVVPQIWGYITEIPKDPERGPM